MAKRKVNQELNLTSYIDLMSTLIIFLLMTAAWNQLDALSSNTSNTTSSDEPPPPSQKETTLAVTILPEKVEMLEDQFSVSIVNVDGLLDVAKVVNQLKAWREKYPKKTDVVLNTDNQVPYRSLIQVFDILVGQGWSDVGVNTL